jgi:hypothetical protein
MYTITLCILCAAEGYTRYLNVLKATIRTAKKSGQYTLEHAAVRFLINNNFYKLAFLRMVTLNLKRLIIS